MRRRLKGGLQTGTARMIERSEEIVLKRVQGPGRRITLSGDDVEFVLLIKKVRRSSAARNSEFKRLQVD